MRLERWAAVVAVVLVGACVPPRGDGPEAARDAAELVDSGVADAGLADAGPADGGFDDGAEVKSAPVTSIFDVSPAPSCTGASGPDAGCLYRKPTYGPVTKSAYLDDATYVDDIGKTRVVPFAVYRAAGAPQPAPVLLMSHGGSGGITSPQWALAEWATLMAQRGYLVVTMAHDEYAGADYDALCAAAGVPVVVGYRCGLKINWARPLDVEAVVSWLDARVASSTKWAQVADLTRLGHLGHSAGAGAAMMLGGVTRNFKCAQPFDGGQGTVVACATGDLVSRRLPQVQAVVALSPQGPGSDGFMDESYLSLAVPMLMGTGLNDGDPGEPANRLLVFDRIPPGQRWKVYVDDPGAKHGFFGGNLAPCENASSPARCEEMRAWLTAAIEAFFDAQLRGNAQGQLWLDSANLATLSGGSATLTSK